MSELAAEVSRQSGRKVTYTDLPQDKYTEFLVSVGVPDGFAGVLADSDHHAASGALYTGTEDLATLLGRPATPLADAVRARLA
jgi:NAD(P)H dehydrogenase (quinone)